jgi:hypothetical protein
MTNCINPSKLVPVVSRAGATDIKVFVEILVKNDKVFNDIKPILTGDKVAATPVGKRYAVTAVILKYDALHGGEIFKRNLAIEDIACQTYAVLRRYFVFDKHGNIAGINQTRYVAIAETSAE